MGSDVSQESLQTRLVPTKAGMLTWPVDAIIDNSHTDFDLWLEVSGSLALYAKAPYHWTKDELTRLLENGHKLFYYSTADRDKVEAYRLIHQTAGLDLTTPPRERVVKLTDAAAELTRILYRHPLTETAVLRASEIGRAMVDCVAEDPSCVSALGKLASHDDYTFYHSARVAAYAIAIAMHLSQHDQKALQDMATGCLLHDVGKSRIELGVLNKRGALTKDEWALMRQHPVLGDEIVGQSLLGAMPRAIVLHHHERFDGSGYPHNLTARELLEEVKIAAFADVFDALTTNRPYQISRTPFEALDFIRHKLLPHVHKDAFQAMVEILKEGASGEKAVDEAG